VQWEEELKFLKRDMITGMRGFESRQRMWTYKAQHMSQVRGMAEYAARKSNFYRKLKDNMVKACDKYVKVSGILLSEILFVLNTFKNQIVTIKWGMSSWPSSGAA
jgi:hypothetical protein